MRVGDDESVHHALNDIRNMTGGVADTLLALVWTQYQYIIFPAIFGSLATKMLLEDWRHCLRESR